MFIMSGLGMMLLIPVLIMGMYANFKVKSNYKKYSKVVSSRGLTGKEVAEQILQRNGITDVSIQAGSGFLTDHYDPRNKTVVLSPSVFSGNSISSASIAAHECGHAIQHNINYGPLAIRSAIAPVASFVSKGMGLIIIVALIVMRFGSPIILDLAIISYIIMAIFQIVTLPVEFDASKRAIYNLDKYGLLSLEDIPGTKKVLNAAALTYVAATLASIVTIIRLVLIRGRR